MKEKGSHIILEMFSLLFGQVAPSAEYIYHKIRCQAIREDESYYLIGMGLSVQPNVFPTFEEENIRTTI